MVHHDARARSQSPRGQKRSAGARRSGLTPAEPAPKKVTGPLTGKQRRALRALGHHLQVVVQVGQDDLTDAVVAACDQALTDHELIKVKVGEGAQTDRHEAGAQLAARTSSSLVQVLGRTLLLFRQHPEKPKISI